MGARDPTRIEKLTSWLRPMPGQIRVAVCAACGHQGALPVDRLIRRLGPDYPVEMVPTFLRCSQCGERRVTAKLLLLCEPGCRRQR